MFQLAKNQFTRGEFQQISFGAYVKMVESINVDHRITSVVGDREKGRQPFVRALINNDITALVMDYDHLTTVEFDEIKRKLLSLECMCFVHTTSTSTSTNPRIRIIFPIMPISDFNYPATVAQLGMPPGWDTKAVGTNRGWYIPEAHIEEIESHRFNYRELIKVVTERAIAETDEYDDDDDGDDGSDDIGDGHGGSDGEKCQDKKPRINRKPSARELTVINAINETCDSFRKEAEQWARMVLGEQFGVRCIVRKECDSGHVAGAFDCPVCKNKMKGSFILDVANGNGNARCFREKCSFKWVYSPNSGVPYDPFTLREFISRLLSICKVKIKRLDSVWQKWWVFGAFYYKEREVLRILEKRTGWYWNDIRKCAPTATVESNPYRLMPFEDVEAECKTKLRTWAAGTKISATGLHCIATDMTTKDICAKYQNMVAQNLSQNQWKVSSITIDGVTQRPLEPGEDRGDFSVANLALYEMGYKLALWERMRTRLGLLAPIVVVNTRSILCSDVQPYTLVMFRQRIALAQARGCQVVLLCRCKSTDLNMFLSRLELPRESKSSIRALPRHGRVAYTGAPSAPPKAAPIQPRKQ